MNKDQFAQEAVGRLMQWDDALILESGKPVGLVALNSLGGHAVVRIFWFPWATVRNKLECTLRFLLDYKDKVHLIAASNEKRFFDHLYRYGVVRGIGVSRSWAEEPVTIYEAT